MSKRYVVDIEGLDADQFGFTAVLMALMQYAEREGLKADFGVQEARVEKPDPATTVHYPYFES